MSRAFYGDHEANGSSQVEERSSKDTLVSAAAQTSPSDIISTQDTSAVEESKIFEVSTKLSGDMVNVVPSPKGKPSDGMSPSEACVQTVEDREYAMGWNELSKTPDNEAAGPQSNQVSSSSAGEPQTASESDLPVVQCACQVTKIETLLDLNTVDLSENKASGICASSIPSQLSDQHRSQEQDACDSLDNSRESLNEEGNKNYAYAAQVVQSEGKEHSPSSCLMVNKQDTENMQKAKNMLFKEEPGSLGEDYDTVKPVQTTANPPISATESDVIVDESEPPNETGYSKCKATVENNGQLEIIGEADDHTQQVQPNNSVSVSENLSREKMSLSPATIADTPARGTPHSNSVYHISTAESANSMRNNGSCSPNVQSGEKKTVCDAMVKEEEKIEAGVCQGHKVVNTDVQSTRESFEDALSSLVRTKESIGRATRLAMDLMKFCVPAKLRRDYRNGDNLEKVWVHVKSEEMVKKLGLSILHGIISYLLNNLVNNHGDKLCSAGEIPSDMGGIVTEKFSEEDN